MKIFFVDFVDFFSVSSFFGPGILIHGSHSHWLTGGGASGILLVLSHMAKAGGYMSRGFFLISMGLAFCPSFFELSTSGFVLLPFWVLSFCEVVVGDLEACFCCCALLR